MSRPLPPLLVLLALLPALLVLAVVPGCRPPRATVHADLRALERQQADHRARIDGLSLELRHLKASQRRAVATYAEAQRSWQAASNLSREATSLGRVTADTAMTAAADFASAQRYYRLATLAIAAAALRGAGAKLCAEQMTTTKYRRLLRRQGVDLRGVDIDHILPKSRGGLDHPLNYQPLEASLNRALGNKVVAKFLQAPLPMIRSIGLSALGRLGGC